jgi:hypothetical protein
MSTPPIDLQNEREKPVSTSPSTPGQETIQDHVTSPRQSSSTSPRPPNRPWLMVAIVAIVIVLLVLSAGIVVVAQLGRQPTPTPNPTATTAVTTTPVPTSTTQPTATPTSPFVPGQWVQVLSGYNLLSLAEAPSHPNVLYACAGPAATAAAGTTVLRSADLGTHWQDIGARAQMGRGSCALAINPTDSFEIYVVTSSNLAAGSSVLKYTSDGGDTWETITPTVHGSGLNSPPPWRQPRFGAEFSFVGNRLYSLLSLPIPPMPTPQEYQGPLPISWERLAMSTDGGHTWEVLDRQFERTWQSVWTYAVNPANPQILYEMVGSPGVSPEDQTSSLVVLYKSTDGGATWQPLLNGQAVTTNYTPLYLARDNPAVLAFLAQCPSSQALQVLGGGPLAVPHAGGLFGLCMSTDGGATWRTIAAPSGLETRMQGGFIDPSGRFYTFVPVQVSASADPGAQENWLQEFWRYDPASRTWSKITQGPRGGVPLAVTPTDTNNSVVLWLMRGASGQAGSQPMLYRYVI